MLTCHQRRNISIPACAPCSGWRSLPQAWLASPQEKRAAKQANEGGHAPGMELATLEQQQQQQQQQQQGMPHDADAAAQAAAEGAAVQGVLDGALPQVHQVRPDPQLRVLLQLRVRGC